MAAKGKKPHAPVKRVLRGHTKFSSATALHDFFNGSHIPMFNDQLLEAYVRAIAPAIESEKAKLLKPPSENDEVAKLPEVELRPTKYFVVSGLFSNAHHKKPGKKRFTFPLPVNAARIIDKRKDFVLPYSIYCPSVTKKPDWKNLRKNVWIDVDIPSINNSTRSTCHCTISCGENCINRLLMYECDENTCPFGKQDCGNRAFKVLAKELQRGRRYANGFEVKWLGLRGYGLRTTRSYSPNELIIEYCGDVISRKEMQRRMKECYANTNNHYILNLEKGTAIDSGLRGSAARFVNHSCSPNSEMQKWHVNGLPRIGLFAIDNIPAGTELTYDYNFDWFEGAQMQICLCGESNCRGFIGKKTLNQKSSTPTSTKSSESSSPVSGKSRKKANSSSKLVPTVKVLKQKTSSAKKTRSSTYSPARSSTEPVLKIEEGVTSEIPETEDECEDINEEPTDGVMAEISNSVSSPTLDETLASEAESNSEDSKVFRKRGRPKGSKTQKVVLLDYYSSTTRLTRSSSSYPLTRSKYSSIATKSPKATKPNLKSTRKNNRTKMPAPSSKKENSDNEIIEAVIDIPTTPEISSTLLDESLVLESSDQSDIEEDFVLDVVSIDQNDEPPSRPEVVGRATSKSTKTALKALKKTGNSINSTKKGNDRIPKNQHTKHENFSDSTSSVRKPADLIVVSSNSEVNTLELRKRSEPMQEMSETDLSTSNSPVPLTKSNKQQNSRSEKAVSPTLSSLPSSSSLTQLSLADKKTSLHTKKSKSALVSKVSRPRRTRKRPVPFGDEDETFATTSAAKNLPSSQKVLSGPDKPTQKVSELATPVSDHLSVRSSVGSTAAAVTAVVDNTAVSPDAITTAPVTGPVYKTQQPISKMPHVTEPQFINMVSSTSHNKPIISPTSTSPYRSIINSSDHQSHSSMNDIPQASQNQQQQYYYPSPPPQAQQSQQQQLQQNQLSQQPPQPLPKITTESFQSAPNMNHSSTAPYIHAYPSNQQVPGYSGYYGQTHQYALVPLHPSASSYPAAGYPPHHPGHVIPLGHNLQHAPPPNVPIPLPSINSSDQMAPPPPPNFLITPSQPQSSHQQPQSPQQFPHPPPPQQLTYQQQQYTQSQRFQPSSHLSQNQLRPPQLDSHKYDSYDQRRLSLPGNSGSDVPRNPEIHHHALSPVSTGHQSTFPPRPRSYSVYQSSTSNKGHAIIEPPRNLITDPQNYRIQHHGSAGSDSNWRQQVSIQSLVSSPPSDLRPPQLQQETRVSQQRTNSISSIVNPHDEYFNNHSVTSKSPLPKVVPTTTSSANGGPALVPDSNFVAPMDATTNPPTSDDSSKPVQVSVQSRTKLMKVAKEKQLTKPKRGRPPNSTRLNLASPHPIAPLASSGHAGLLLQSMKPDSASIRPKTGSTASGATTSSDKSKRRPRAANNKPSITIPSANKPRRGRPPNSGPAQRNFLAPLALRPQVLPVGGNTAIPGSGSFFNRMPIKSNYLGPKSTSGSRGVRLEPSKLSGQSLLGKRLRVGEDNSILAKRSKGFSSVIPSTHAVVVAPVTISKSQGLKGKGTDSNTKSGRTESPKLTVSNAIKAAIGSNSKVTPVAVTPVKSFGMSGTSGLATVLVRNSNERTFSTPSDNSDAPKRGRGRPRIRPKDYWTYNNRKARGEFGPGSGSNNNSSDNNSTSDIFSSSTASDGTSLTSPRELKVYEPLVNTQPRTGPNGGCEFLAVNSKKAATTAAAAAAAATAAGFSNRK